MKNLNFTQILNFTFPALFLFALSACENGTINAGTSSSSSTGGVTFTTGDSSGSTYTFTIASVSLGSGSPLPVTVGLVLPTPAITTFSQVCGTASTNACGCLFKWAENNVSTGSTVSIAHNVTTSVTTANQWSALCTVPLEYAALPVGTPVYISLVNLAGNTNTISTTNSFKITTSGNNGTVNGGNFTDQAGNSYSNISHYSCYSLNTRGTSMTNATNSLQDGVTTGVTAPVPLASAFCLGSSGSTGTNCTKAPTNGASNESSYYNLYIPQSEVGDINLGNSGFVCPMVQEGLGSGTKSYWPLDSSFSLSVNQSSNFSVGVEAFTKTVNSGDPTSGSSTCSSGTSGTTDTTVGSGTTTSGSGLVSSCLGFAAPPSTTDGTCPAFTDSTGKLQLTYRLRKYVAIYPPFFNETGAQAAIQTTDYAYVLDRPVSSASSNPLKPFTMKGPKPCPWAYFDSAAVTALPQNATGNTDYLTGFIPSFVGTPNSAWTGNNADGLQYPNVDQWNASSTNISCSAAVPVLSPDQTMLSVATVNKNNPALKSLAIRPINAWTPHYLEDTSFQACAPLSSLPKEAPLHFSRNTTTGNVGWCSESYPSQDDSIPQLDSLNSAGSAYGGLVVPFTSHVKKNTSDATVCTTAASTVLTSVPTAAANPSYPNTGNAHHPVAGVWETTFNMTDTCDRTVEGLAQKMPLLAPAGDVETALQTDQSYSCTVTYDNGGGKTGTKSPTSGCCATGILSNTVITGAASAHLEPVETTGASQCGSPTY